MWMRLSGTCVLRDAHLKWRENPERLSAASAVSALPRLEIRVENSVYHTFNHDVRECVCRREVDSFKIRNKKRKKRLDIQGCRPVWAHRVQVTGGKGPSETAGRAGVKVYWKTEVRRFVDGDVLRTDQQDYGGWGQWHWVRFMCRANSDASYDKFVQNKQSLAFNPSVFSNNRCGRRLTLTPLILSRTTLKREKRSVKPQSHPANLPRD